MIKKPVFLNLFEISFPVTAIVSILHRISGIILFLVIPWLIWILEHSLNSPEEFYAIQKTLNSPFKKISIGIILLIFIYHFIAGIRHIVMDIGICESKKAARISAILILLFFAISIGWLEYSLWLVQ